MPADELRERLAQWQPWSVLIEFSNGVSTEEFSQRSLFESHPLYKLSKFEGRVAFEGSVLDVGCGTGYNCIHLARKGVRALGVDVHPDFLEAARFLASVANVGADFQLGHGDSFVSPEPVDTVLHLGVLYHLQNPLRSLQSACESLKRGGWLCLETMVYDDPVDDRLCYFIHPLNNDRTNFFALSTKAIRDSLELLGFEEIEECFRHAPTGSLHEHMSRVGLVAQKAGNRDLSKGWPQWA